MIRQSSSFRYWRCCHQRDWQYRWRRIQSPHCSDSNEYPRYHREALWKFLGPAKYRLHMIGIKNKKRPTLSQEVRSISVENQFFLFLRIFRRNISYTEAGFMFGISRNLASNVFKTWLSFLYYKFKGSKEFVLSVCSSLSLKECRIVKETSKLH